MAMLMAEAGNFCIGYGGQGEQKSARRMKPVWGEWAVVFKAQTFQILSLPQVSFAKIRELRREVCYCFLTCTGVLQTKAFEMD